MTGEHYNSWKTQASKDFIKSSYLLKSEMVRCCAIVIIIVFFCLLLSGNYFLLWEFIIVNGVLDLVKYSYRGNYYLIYIFDYWVFQHVSYD